MYDVVIDDPWVSKFFFFLSARKHMHRGSLRAIRGFLVNCSTS